MTDQAQALTAEEESGACICDYSPSSTGPEEHCPQHGRPYAYWVKRGDVLAARDVGRADPAPKGADEERWDDAVDWLLNSRYTGDPDIQTPFWARVDGHITSRELRDEKLSVAQIQRRIDKAEREATS